MIYKKFSYIQEIIQNITSQVENITSQVESDRKQRIGTIFYASTLNQENALLCNGAKVLKTKYTDLYNKILNTFGTETSTEFYLPNLINKVPWGVSSGAGGNISSGLPNITGSFVINQNCIGGGSGAIYRSGSDVAYYHESGHTTIAGHINFEAKRSNSIYGASSIVQPPALKLYPFIYFK